MNRKIKILAVLLTVTYLWSAPVASAYHCGKVVISATVIKQKVIGDNTLTTVKSTLTTETLLKQLAKDEYAAGLWSRTNFPSGASLQFDGNIFVVVAGTNSIVVSNILTWSGGSAVVNNPGAVSTMYGPATVTFDDSAFTDALVFSATGFGVTTTRTTGLIKAITGTGIATETIVISLQNGTGTGTFDGNLDDWADFVLTGFTLTASPATESPPDYGGGGFSLGSARK